MKACILLAWFYWDPPREAFTVPFLDHPVMWYGILFVTGFILAYFVINPIFARFLLRTRALSSLDITHWPLILSKLQTSVDPLISQLLEQLDSTTRQQLTQQKFLTPVLQQKILEGFNRLFKHPSISRSELQRVFAPAIASPQQTAYILTDRLCWFVVIGTIVGARLGAVFFYDWPYFREHPFEILKVWQGGLASHGGTVGVMATLYLYMKYIQQWIPQLTFLRLLDYVAVPSALVACFIRLGNFMNQEILGIPTTLPWGVIFGHAADGGYLFPRHPVQLYEATAYLIIFFILWHVWKNQHPPEPTGQLIGLLFILIFGSRLILEFWKSTQESIIYSSSLQMGQILSLPFVLLGIFLFCYSKRSRRST